MLRRAPLKRILFANRRKCRQGEEFLAGHFAPGLAQEKHERLHAVGVNWNDYPAFFKRGVFVRRETVLKTLSEEAFSKIPEKYRPTEPVARSMAAVLDMPPASRIANLVGALLLGEPPILKAEAGPPGDQGAD